MWAAILGAAALGVGVLAAAAFAATIPLDAMFLLRLRRGRSPRLGFIVFQAARATSFAYILVSAPLLELLFLGSLLAGPAVAVLLLRGRRPTPWLIGAAAVLIGWPALLTSPRLIGLAQSPQARVVKACTPGGPSVELTFSGTLSGRVVHLCSQFSELPHSINYCQAQMQSGLFHGETANLTFVLNGHVYKLGLYVAPPTETNGQSEGSILPVTGTVTPTPDKGSPPRQPRAELHVSEWTPQGGTTL